MEEKDCPFSLRWENIAKGGRVRICSELNGAHCIEENHHNCPVHNMRVNNANLKAQVTLLEQGNKALQIIESDLVRENRDLKTLRFIEKESKKYLDICDVCGHNLVNCLECPNKNCRDFCYEISRKLEGK